MFFKLNFNELSLFFEIQAVFAVCVKNYFFYPKLNVAYEKGSIKRKKLLLKIRKLAIFASAPFQRITSIFPFKKERHIHIEYLGISKLPIQESIYLDVSLPIQKWRGNNEQLSSKDQNKRIKVFSVF